MSEACPFCGKTGEQNIFLERDRHGASRIICDDCGAQGPRTYEGTADAWRLWNERILVVAAVAAEREACAKRVEKCAQYCQDIADDEGMLLYPQVVAGNQFAATVLGEAVTAIRAREWERLER